MKKNIRKIAKRCGTILCAILLTCSMTMTAWATEFRVADDGTTTHYYVDGTETTYDVFNQKFKELFRMDYSDYASGGSGSSGSGSGGSSGGEESSSGSTPGNGSGGSSPSGSGSSGESWEETNKKNNYNTFINKGFEYVSQADAISRINSCMKSGGADVKVFCDGDVDFNSIVNANKSNTNTYPSYWVYSGTFSWSTSTTTSYSAIDLSRSVSSHLAISSDQQSALDAKVASVASTIGGSTADKIQGAYNYLVNNVTYDYSYSRHNPYQAIVENNSVCEGYATAFQLLMEKLGVESYIVTGTIDGVGHAWNAVNCDGTYYYVDATFGATSKRYGVFMMFGTDVRNNITSLPISSGSYNGNTLGNNSVQINSDGTAVVVNNDTGETVTDETETQEESTEEMQETSEQTEQSQAGENVLKDTKNTEENESESNSQSKKSKGVSVYVWVLIGVAVIGAAAGGTVLFIRKKKWKKV